MSDNKETALVVKGALPGALQRYAGEDFERTSVKLSASKGIGTQGGVFKLGGEDLGTSLSVCVVDWVSLNIYYEGRFNPSVQRGASCFAVGRGDCDHLIPPTDLGFEPRNVECGDCPLNEWGSDPEGGRGKACKNTVRLLVTPVDELRENPDASALDVYELRVPVTSVKAWNKIAYAAEDRSSLPVCSYEVLIGIVAGESGGHVLTFELVDYVGDTDEVVEAARDLRHVSQVQLLAPPFLESDGDDTDKAPARGKTRRPGAKRAAGKAPAKRKRAATKKAGAKRTRKR